MRQLVLGAARSLQPVVLHVFYEVAVFASQALVGVLVLVHFRFLPYLRISLPLSFGFALFFLVGLYFIGFYFLSETPSSGVVRTYCL